MSTGSKRQQDHEISVPETDLIRPEQEHVRLLQQEENLPYEPQTPIKYENCFTIQDTEPTCPQPSKEKGHFILLTLASSDSKNSTQILFQLYSAAPCNTLPSKYLVNMPWAKQQPTNTVIMPYASPPIIPTGQVNLNAIRETSLFK